MLKGLGGDYKGLGWPYGESHEKANNEMDAGVT